MLAIKIKSKWGGITSGPALIIKKGRVADLTYKGSTAS